MIKNFDESMEINHNPNWPYITDHCYRILIIGGSESGEKKHSWISHKQLMFMKI